MQTHPLPIASSAPAPSAGQTSRLSRLSDWQFRTLLLAMAAIAAMMAAEGLQTFAEMARRNAALSARYAAISPVAYGTVLPALHALAPAQTAPRVLLRADSDGGESAALCALASAGGRASNVVWIALSASVEPCVSRAGVTVHRADPPAVKEFSTARWILLDPDGAVRYSSRDIPSPERLGQITSLLAPAAGPEIRP